MFSPTTGGGNLIVNSEVPQPASAARPYGAVAGFRDRNLLHRRVEQSPMPSFDKSSGESPGTQVPTGRSQSGRAYLRRQSLGDQLSRIFFIAEKKTSKAAVSYLISQISGRAE